MLKKGSSVGTVAKHHHLNYGIAPVESNGSHTKNANGVPGLQLDLSQKGQKNQTAARTTKGQNFEPNQVCHT